MSLLQPRIALVSPLPLRPSPKAQWFARSPSAPLQLLLAHVSPFIAVAAELSPEALSAHPHREICLFEVVEGCAASGYCKIDATG